jgi:hypothetical protein
MGLRLPHRIVALAVGDKQRKRVTNGASVVYLRLIEVMAAHQHPDRPVVGINVIATLTKFVALAEASLRFAVYLAPVGSAARARTATMLAVTVATTTGDAHAMAMRRGAHVEKVLPLAQAFQGKKETVWLA